MIASNPFEDAPVIFRYTRRQAIEDGVLVDLSPWARETAFRIPVACTATVWNQHIVPPEDTRELGQSERGRAHDLLCLLYWAILRAPDPLADGIVFEVMFVDSHKHLKIARLKALCGPGDEDEPVLTLMLPNED
jgi:hypothetical protein